MPDGLADGSISVMEESGFDVNEKWVPSNPQSRYIKSSVKT